MNTAVITTGGLGTRMLTFTKSNPKTMLPIYTKSNDSSSTPMFKPLIDYIFENLYDNGFRRFCFIVGSKTKSVIIDHMEPETKFIELLQSRNLSEDKVRFTVDIANNSTTVLGVSTRDITAARFIRLADT